MTRTRPRQPRLSLPGGTHLRPWEQDDAAALTLAFRDPLIRRYAVTLWDDRAGAMAGILDWSSSWRSGEGAAWAVSEPGGTVLGSVRYGVQDAGLGLASVGYWIVPEARGRGLATAALAAGTKAALAHFGWHRVELHHAVENERSCAVARRCGYAYEGVMREAMRYPDDGRWSDEHLHARLAGDA